MKMLTYFSIYFIALLQFACTKPQTTEVLSYPKNFSYESMTSDETKFFIKTADGYIEIPPSGSGSFADYKTDVISETEEFYLELPFNKAVLLSETDAHLSNDQSDATYFGFDMDAKYAIQNDIITFALKSGNQTETIEMVQDNSIEPELYFLLRSEKHSYHVNGNLLTQYSPINSAYENSKNFVSALNGTIAEHNLQTGDTIAINYSKLIYR